jgi:hypothetical protein
MIKTLTKDQIFALEKAMGILDNDPESSDFAAITRMRTIIYENIKMIIPDGYRTAYWNEYQRHDVKIYDKCSNSFVPRKDSEVGELFLRRNFHIVPKYKIHIPEGYRYAKQNEHTRDDAKYWNFSNNEWELWAEYHNDKLPFMHGGHYIVPITPVNLQTFSPPGKEKTPMQTKLTKEQIEKLKQARNGIKSVLVPTIDHQGVFWLEVLGFLDAKIYNGTSDGKPWVEPESPIPEIPEGYRLAEPDEYKRGDVLFWWIDYSKWEPRTYQGSRFDDPSEKTIYIVPNDTLLTDEDACVFPRKLVMVRQAVKQLWKGPYSYVGRDAVYYCVLNEHNKLSMFTHIREATQTEIEAAQ